MRHLLTTFLISSLLVVSGCAGQQAASSARQQTAPPSAVGRATADGLVDARQDNYFVWRHQGRIYVIGQAKTNAFFAEHHHLPYTRTLLGAGPNGETVVFEVDKKDPALAKRLEQTFQSRPFPLHQEKNYYVFKHHGRLYVVGSAKSRDAFAEHGHLPYTRTLLGAGPNGETVVFEVDKKDPALAKRLEQTFNNS